jgi:hypothetical protein
MNEIYMLATHYSLDSILNHVLNDKVGRSGSSPMAITTNLLAGLLMSAVSNARLCS